MGALENHYQRLRDVVADEHQYIRIDTTTLKKIKIYDFSFFSFGKYRFDKKAASKYGYAIYQSKVCTMLITNILEFKQIEVSFTS